MGLKKEGRQTMDRIEKVKNYVDAALRRARDYEFRKEAVIHVYGVAQACAMLAMRRGEDAELAVIAGLLHDIWTYSKMDSREHAHKGAKMAGEILESMGLFEEDEIRKICRAIYHHSGKAITQEPFDEVLKDADVFQHCMYNPLKEASAKEYARFEKLKKELGLEAPEQ